VGQDFQEGFRGQTGHPGGWQIEAFEVACRNLRGLDRLRKDEAYSTYHSRENEQANPVASAIHSYFAMGIRD
jgi:hypothetical protein